MKFEPQDIGDMCPIINVLAAEVMAQLQDNADRLADVRRKHSEAEAAQ
ncbi:MAG: hypothetical protein ACYC0X_00110 [Pirellulaceae bacterium]